MLPIETNAERPRSRLAAASITASPSAPLCDENPIVPSAPRYAQRSHSGGVRRPRCRGSSGRSGAHRASGRARAAPLTLSSLSAHLGESGRDDAERADAPAQARLRGRDHMLTGNAHDREIDCVPDLLDRGIPANTSDRNTLPVDRISRALKSALRMLRNSSPPIEPRRGEAPSTATPCGAKNGSSDARTASWSRRSTRSR